MTTNRNEHCASESTVHVKRNEMRCERMKSIQSHCALGQHIHTHTYGKIETAHIHPKSSTTCHLCINTREAAMALLPRWWTYDFYIHAKLYEWIWCSTADYDNDNKGSRSIVHDKTATTKTMNARRTCMRICAHVPQFECVWSERRRSEKKAAYRCSRHGCDDDDHDSFVWKNTQHHTRTNTIVRRVELEFCGCFAVHRIYIH